MLELQVFLNFSANINAGKQSSDLLEQGCVPDWDSFVISNAVRQLAGTMDKLESVR